MAETIDLSDLDEERRNLRLQKVAGPLDDEDQERLDALNELDLNLWCGLAGGAKENRFLIAEDEWKDYVQDYVDGLADIPDFIEPFVDWDGLADSLRTDYQTVTFDGATYLMRG